MKRPRVLLAEDHRIVAEGLKSLLAADYDLAGEVEDGLAMIEAQAVGVPVLASAVDGIVEHVHDGVNGRLAPPGDARAIGDALVEMLFAHEQRLRLARARGSHRPPRPHHRDRPHPRLRAGARGEGSRLLRQRARGERRRGAHLRATG